MLRSLTRLWRRPATAPLEQLAQSDEERVRALRQRGVRIGVRCRIYATEFSTEPYLVTIGDDVGIAGGVKILTHNGAAQLLRRERPMLQSFGPVTIGDRCFVGENALLLPGTTIGSDCIVVAGAVVRGTIPDNSLVAGNPAVVIGRASVFLARLARSPDSLDTFGMTEAERRATLNAHFKLGAAPDAEP